MNIQKISYNTFLVTVDGIDFSVTVDDDYYQELTEEKCSKEELVKASFKFLLDREAKESILKSFNLKVISSYFPEYADRIKDYI